MGSVRAVCRSEKKGTAKTNVHTGEFLVSHGLVGDAHAGDWRRQVSLLSFEKVEDFRARGAEVADGAFGENLVVEGIDFRKLPVGTILECGEVILEMTQIGKECHSHCAIFKVMGDCIMPREGVFARVLQGGAIRVGDEMRIRDAAPGTGHAPAE
jgi:TatD DNase family protein